MGRPAELRKVAKRKASRKFLGKLDGFTDKLDKSFNEKMLKAYLKGKEYFNFGFEKEHFTGRSIPKSHKVLQSYS